MNIQLAPQLARRSRLFTQVASIAVIMLGSLVLTGWQLQIQGFKSILPGLVSMDPSTAAGMFLCGTALSLLSHKETKAFRFLATVLAMVVIAFGLLILSEYFFGWDLPLDHWLSGREVEPSQLERMAPTAALCFILTGGAVFTAPRRIRRPLQLPLVAALGAAVMVIGALALIGHVFEAVSGSRSWNYTGMAVHTAAGFLLLGSTTLGLARSRATLGWSLNATTTGGFLLGIVLMVAVAAVSYNLTRQLQGTGILVGHTQEILKEIQEVEVSMLTIETGQRGYIITGDETLVEERDALETDVQEHLAKLRELTSDNPNQRRRLDRIQPLIAERIRWGDETLLARRRSGFSAAQERVSAGAGRALLEECNRIFKEMEDDEYALLAKRQKYSETASQMTFLLLPLGVFLSLAGLSLGLFFLNAGMGERKRAEHSLRQSEEGMRAILDSTLDCIITMDHHGRVVVFNPAAEKTFGYPREKAIGQLLSELIIPPSLRDRHQKGLSRYLATGEEQVLGKRLEMTAMRSDGSEFPVELAITRIGSQEPPMFTGFIRDITERRFSDEAIRASEQRFSSFMDNVPGFAWMKDAEGRYVYGNKFFQALLIAEEWRGRTVEEVWPPEIAAPLRANDEKVVETKAPLQTMEMIVQAGEKRAVLSSKFPILNGNGEVAFVCGIGIDITERTQAEGRLREQADIINRAHDAIIIRNFETEEITFWNKGAEHLYGWSAEEALGKPIGELIFADPKDREAPLKLLVSTGEFHGETKQIAKDGREIIVYSRARVIRGGAGELRSVLLINTDVTEQKKLETHLLRAQRLESIGTLASGVAHDLNNILTPILICAEVLKGNPAAEDILPTISLIEESARRGAAVVKQVLTFARGIEGERVTIKPSHLIEEMLDIARKTFPKSIEITSRYPEDLATIECDPTQLHQVLLNLSVNARDAMPNGGRLTITAENFDVDEHYASMTPGAKTGPHVMLRVSDTGTGMPQANIDKIFDPFFTTKEVGKGTGLGLSTALGIIKSHGGFISVYTEVGIGTTFKVFLPAKVSEETLQKSRVPSELLEGNGELILVVDDEPGILRASKMILEKQNYRVLTANDGPEALALIAHQKDAIRLVISDISMPYMDGVMLIRAIKKMKPDTAILASTGQGEQGRMAELQSLSVNNFLTKPYNTEKLLLGLRNALEGRVGDSPPISGKTLDQLAAF
jgi:PAS domain S-box-containing protein